MSRDDDENKDGLDDPDLPDESDMDDSDEPDLLPCPHCRKMINEDTVRCPHCGDYVSVHDIPNQRTPWFVLVILALLLILIFWCFTR